MTQTHTTGCGRCIRNELITKYLGELEYPPASDGVRGLSDTYTLCGLSSCCGPPTLGACPLHNLEFAFSCQPHLYGTSPLQLDDVIGTERWQYMSGQRRRATSTHSWVHKLIVVHTAHKLRRCADTKWSCSCCDAKDLHRGLHKSEGLLLVWWGFWGGGGMWRRELQAGQLTLIGCGEYTQECSFDGKCVWNEKCLTCTGENGGGVIVAV